MGAGAGGGEWIMGEARASRLRLGSKSGWAPCFQVWGVVLFQTKVEAFLPPKQRSLDAASESESESQVWESVLVLATRLLLALAPLFFVAWAKANVAAPRFGEVEGAANTGARGC